MVAERELVGAAGDGELARRAVSGDRAAEAELCRRFAPRVRLYGLKHLRDEDRARDLVQAVLVTVIESLRAGRVEDLDRIDRFMLGTARNLCARRRQQDARTTPTDTAELDLGAFMPVLATLDIDALVHCIAALEVRAQTVVHLSFYRDKRADEIAAVLETSPGNVRVLRHRAIEQLRDCLAAKEAA
jgi:RNA polymerase sigma-70 factor (ECF subfamily)